MQIIHVYLTNPRGNAKIYSFNYDDGREELASREIVMPYENQSLEAVIEELTFKFIEETKDAQSQEFYCQPNSSGEFWD
jgi:hypothetical protein